MCYLAFDNLVTSAALGEVCVRTEHYSSFVNLFCSVYCAFSTEAIILYFLHAVDCQYQYK